MIYTGITFLYLSYFKLYFIIVKLKPDSTIYRSRSVLLFSVIFLTFAKKYTHGNDNTHK